VYFVKGFRGGGAVLAWTVFAGLLCDLGFLELQVEYVLCLVGLIIIPLVSKPI
jgi:hypothetical protein